MKKSMHPYSPDKLTERLKLDLHINSPIHIGSQESRLLSSEFVFSSGRTHFIDESRLSLFLKEKELIDLYIKEVGTGAFNMEKFLSRELKTSLKDFISEISSMSAPGGSENMREFKPFIRDGNKDMFLPGSSLKGMFRTALLYGILEENQEKKLEIEKTAKEKLNLLPRYKQTFSERWVNEDLLQRFRITKGRIGPDKDIFRCLKVRDAYPVGNIQTKVIKIKFLSKSNGKGFDWSYRKRGGKSTDQPLELWAEVIVNGVFRTELIWDRLLFEKFKKADSDIKIPVNGLDDLISIVFRMNRRIFSYEADFFSGVQDEAEQPVANAVGNLKNWYEMNAGDYIRLGFGSGMLSTSVNLHFNEALRQKIRDLCGHKRENDPAPKSRRICQGDYGQWMSLGWMKMVPASEDDVGAVHGKPSVHMSAVSNLDKLLEELSLVKPNDMGRIGTIVQKIDTLETDKEKGVLAKAVQDKIGLRAFKKHKKMEYMRELIFKAGL
ncbi:MAG: type III-A CRISPR-associated RAMP protein Csm5 [Desulfobacteraceae bacterium]|nr:type III-A CRISPR-associated RAMP protein Csm5 [Desulfobacteraceae bacterium]